MACHYDWMKNLPHLQSYITCKPYMDGFLLFISEEIMYLYVSVPMFCTVLMVAKSTASDSQNVLVYESFQVWWIPHICAFLKGKLNGMCFLIHARILRTNPDLPVFLYARICFLQFFPLSYKNDGSTTTRKIFLRSNSKHLCPRSLVERSKRNTHMPRSSKEAVIR